MPSGNARSLFADTQFVFLDRDGVINKKLNEGEYVSTWERFELLPGVENAIATLNRAGRAVIVVTNQRGVALGLYTSADVEDIHKRLQAHLALHGAHVDALYYCPHDNGECDCRKPATGLFEKAFQDFPSASPANSVVVGDSLSDIEAGKKLKMRTLFVQGEESTRKPGADRAAIQADAVTDSLAQAVEIYFQT
ncbi:MAG TPA: HAD family hydrolase [Acidobacteriaceae bacterium]|jgi:D-glycero-D-manno-heptose 1,7-bisphosphate phosphatase